MLLRAENTRAISSSIRYENKQIDWDLTDVIRHTTTSPSQPKPFHPSGAQRVLRFAPVAYIPLPINSTLKNARNIVRLRKLFTYRP